MYILLTRLARDVMVQVPSPWFEIHKIHGAIDSGPHMNATPSAQMSDWPGAAQVLGGGRLQGQLELHLFRTRRLVSR